MSKRRNRMRIRILLIVVFVLLNVSCGSSVQDVNREVGLMDGGDMGVSRDVVVEDGLSGGDIMGVGDEGVVERDAEEVIEDTGALEDVGVDKGVVDDTGVEDTGDSEVIHRDVGGDSYGCSNPCECNSGEVCSSGECIRWDETPGPHLFCCTDPECPSHSNCIYRDGKYGVCSGGIVDGGVDISEDIKDVWDVDISDIVGDEIKDVNPVDIYDAGADVSYKIIPPLTIEVEPGNLASGVEQQRYNQAVKMIASGGNPPYKYSCSGYGVSGMMATASGDLCTISGTPAGHGGYIVSVTVTDSSYGIASRSLYINIEPSNCVSSKMIVSEADFYIMQEREEIKAVSILDNCGRKLDYDAVVTGGGEWLSIVSTGKGLMELKISSRGKGVNKYTGRIHITSGSLVSDVDVVMNVMGGCVSSDVKEVEIYRNVVVGKYLPYDVISIEDNCGNAVDYEVGGLMGGWIVSPVVGDRGKGVMYIHYDTSGLSVGRYEGNINMKVSGYGERGITIHLEVTNKVEEITRLTVDNTRIKFWLGPKEYRYFYFMTASNDGNDLNVYNHNLGPDDILEVRLEPYANAYAGGDMLVRYAGPTCDGHLPTLDELNMTWQQSVHDPRWYADYKDGKIVGYSWHPARWRDDLYYYLSEGAFETPRIGGDPHYPLGCWYILVYNDDRLQQGYTDLYISFREYAAKVHGPGY
jgi:hypothetical protein